MSVPELGPGSQKVLTLLLREVPQEQKKILLQEIAGLEKLVSRYATLPVRQDAGPRILKGRTASSASISRKINKSEEVRFSAQKNWLQANDVVLRALSEGRFFKLGDLIQLNALVLGDSNGSLRSTPASLEDQLLVDAKDVPSLLGLLFSHLENRSFFHPIERAAFIYQWLISIHPFADGNGRTARLICDWSLAMDGLHPLSFENELDCSVAIFADREENYPPEHALNIIIRGIKNSIECLWSL